MAEKLSLPDLFKELAERAQTRGVSSQDMWDELVDELLVDHGALGDLPDMDPIRLRRELTLLYAGYNKLHNAQGTDNPEQNQAMRDSYHGLDE